MTNHALTLQARNGNTVTFTDPEWTAFVALAGAAGVDVETIALNQTISAADAERLATWLGSSELVVSVYGTRRRIRAIDADDTDPALAAAARLSASAGLDSLASSARSALLAECATQQVEALSAFEAATVEAWISVLRGSDGCDVVWC